MDESFLQELLVARNPEEKAAIVAESIFNTLLPVTSLVARRCSILHWFDETIVKALLKDIPLATSQFARIYEQVKSLPFVESLPWGLTFNSLTREGLLSRYSVTDIDLLKSASQLAAPAYRAHKEDEKISAEALFCYIIAGEAVSALELLNELVQQATTRRNWEYISGLWVIINEAQHFPFVSPLPLLDILEPHRFGAKLTSTTKQTVQNEMRNALVTSELSLQLPQGGKVQDRILDGDLQTLDLQSILKMLALSGKTGTLFVHSGPETLSISLRKCQIVALREEGVPQPDLLMMLCLVNKLDPPRAQAIREHSGGNIQVALAILVERNWMSAAEMQRRLEFAITQSISHALRWIDGRFAFHRQLVSIEIRMQPLDIDSTLLEALRQADEWEEMGEIHLTRTTVARWLPEINNDVRSLGLNQEYIEVLCLSNGELPLQAIALVLMTPEARVARIMSRLLELHLIEVVDTALETEVQQDISNLIIKCQTSLARQQQSSNPEQHLLGLVTVLSDCINGLLAHHGKYAKSLRGRGQLPNSEIVRYLERRFANQLQLLSKQQYPILETIEFTNGRLDCTSILTLDKLVKGEQLEEFYWEAVLGLAAFLRMVFAELLRDEVGNSHTGRNLNFAWKAFLTEIDQEIQQYQVYRAQRNARLSRGRDAIPPTPMGITQNWHQVPEDVSVTSTQIDNEPN